MFDELACHTACFFLACWNSFCAVRTLDQNLQPDLLSRMSDIETFLDLSLFCFFEFVLPFSDAYS